jgi:hypothetical protein
MPDLRDHLFEQLERLKDKDLPLADEIQRARAVCGVAREIIEAAKVEVAFAKAVDARPNSEFFGSTKDGDVPAPRRINGRA